MTDRPTIAAQTATDEPSVVGDRTNGTASSPSNGAHEESIVRDRATIGAPASAPSVRRRSAVASIAVGAARRWRLTLVLLGATLLVGAYAFAIALDREGFPPVNTPISIVSGTYFVDDAGQVDQDVAAPLAAAFDEVDGVIETTTSAQPNGFAVVVEFEQSVSSEDGTAALVALDVPLPVGAEADYAGVDASKFVGEYDVLVSLIGPPGTDPTEAQAEAGRLAEVFEADADIAEADVRELLTSSTDPVTGEEEIRPTRFTRVAINSAGGYVDGISVGVVRAADSDLDVIEFTDRVDELLAESAGSIDAGFTAQITADFGTGVETQLSSLSQNLLGGLIAVALVSLVLIGWRVAVLTASFMVLVLLAAMIGLWLVGYSLNTITLFGLILTLGLLVDNAVVVSESIDASRDDASPAEADADLGVLRTAIERVGSASLAGTLTTIMVFSPLLFVTGILGEFIRPIPATVIITLSISFACAVVFIPTLARWFLLRGRPAANPVIRAQQAAARGAGRLASSRPVVGGVLAATAVASVLGGAVLAGNLGFSIFPSGKDANGLIISAELPPGTTIEEAEERSRLIDAAVLDVVGDELVRSQYTIGDEREIEIYVDLTPFTDRSTTAPQFVERIEDRVAGLEDLRVTVNQIENAPPVDDFPFAVQIDADANAVGAAQALADELGSDLLGTTVRSGGETFTIVDTIVSTDGEVARRDGERFVEVRAKFDDDSSITGVLGATEDLVRDSYGADELASRDLAADSLAFDFGEESDNQDDFAALGLAGSVAVGLVLLLITIQFRSLAQSLLIVLAIPFSFLGVTTALTLSDNPLSFLAVVGFIALTGIAVNNTILLVDAANSRRRAGSTPSEAISAAVVSRFRPIVATTLTTVVGLTPLALGDPFWESLGFTLIGGLISSTILVLLAFPAFYIGLEAVRTRSRNAVRRRTGRPEVA